MTLLGLWLNRILGYTLFLFEGLQPLLGLASASLITKYPEKPYLLRPVLTLTLADISLLLKPCSNNKNLSLKCKKK